MNFLFGMFLIAHGLIHASFMTPKPPQKEGAPEWPFSITKSKILEKLKFKTKIIKHIGSDLTILCTLGFLFAGLGYIGVPGLSTIWLPLTIISSVASIIMLALFWHKWFIFGPLIDVVLLILIAGNVLK